jgi:hypothetical protein
MKIKMLKVQVSMNFSSRLLDYIPEFSEKNQTEIQKPPSLLCFRMHKFFDDDLVLLVLRNRGLGNKIFVLILRDK